MCLGPHFDLCRCGCSEAAHEDEHRILLTYPPQHARGKCNGFRYRIVPREEPQVPIEGYVPEEGGAVRVPCECTGFRPIFESQCHGFGF
jgi:hypothetical protein